MELMLETANTTVMQGFNKSERCPRDTRMTQLVFPALYTVVFLTGLLLNTLALWVFIHIPSNSTFTVYLKNTLVADLIMTLMLPFKILSDSHLGPWQLRGFVCIFSSVIFYETMYVGIIMLGLIAFDRFLKIIRPFKNLFAKKPAFAKAVSISIWVLMFLISFPNMILNNKEATPSSVKKCASLKSPLGLVWHQVVNQACQFIFWTVFILMLPFYVVITKKVYNSYKKFTTHHNQRMGLNLTLARLPSNELYSQASHSANSTSVGRWKNSTHHNEFDTIILPVLYLVIFVASILLNGLAVWIFFHIRNKTSFIFYLKNIVVADLIMTMTFPFRIVRDSGFGPWYIEFILCRYTSVLFYANMYTSIVFLGLISVDRYLKVVKPFGDSRMYSITFTKVLSICVWVVMAVLSLPNIILTNGQPTKENIHDCMKLKNPLGAKWHMAVTYVDSCLFVAVLVILIGCYIAISRYIHKSSRQFISQSSRKRKHNQSIRVVVAVFFTCFLPYHLCRIPFTFSHLDRLLDESAHKILYYCKEMTLFLSACNVCLDPIIYFFMCRSFSRRLFKKSNIRTRSESIRSLQSVRRSEVRIYYDYTDV
ncbi:G-protein coupled receptor 87 isoform 2 [Cricetulus griseus]|nr:G-protein coupled receptor 87 isoform 2 [Cricetulus griseus]